MKKNFYVVATVVLMLMVSLLVHLLISTYRLGYFPPVGTTNFRYILPLEARWSVAATGIVLGCYVAEHRWDIVYIQKRHRARNCCSCSCSCKNKKDKKGKKKKHKKKKK